MRSRSIETPIARLAARNGLTSCRAGSAALHCLHLTDASRLAKRDLGGKGAGLSKGKDTVELGYKGPATLVWGSWLIEGEARVEPRAGASAIVSPADGIAPTPDGPVYEGCVGAFTANSDTEPGLLSTLAGALGEKYSLCWEQDGEEERLPIAVTARHGNRIHFETRS